MYEFSIINVRNIESLCVCFQAGLYYIILMDQSVSKLFFITVVLYGLCLVIVYGKYFILVTIDDLKVNHTTLFSSIHIEIY